MRIKPQLIGPLLGLLALLLFGSLWWALSDSDAQTEEPVRPHANTSEPVKVNDPTLVRPESGRDDAGQAPPEQPEPELPKIKLIVRVLDERGSVVPKANLGVTDSEGQTALSIRRPEKQHEFPGLAPGTWELTTYAVGYCNLDLTLELTAEQNPHEVTIELQDAMLVPVRFLTPNGENAVELLDTDKYSPLKGADLYAIATETPPEATLPRLAPGARPQYGAGLFHSPAGIIPGESPIKHPGPDYAGVLELKSPPPLFVSGVLRETVLETISLGASGAREIVFTVNPDRLLSLLSNLSVRVLSLETNAPIEGLKLSLEDANIDESGQHGATAPEKGMYTFELRFPGSAILRAYAPDHEIYQMAVSLKAGETTDLGTIYLTESVTVKGTVKNEDGEGVRSVIFAHDENWNAADGPPQSGNTVGGSGRDGTLRLNRMGKRKYRVQVTARGYAPQWIDLDLTHEDEKPLNIVLGNGTKTIFATRYDADLTHRVSLYDSRGQLCFSEFIPGMRTRDTWLAPGAYTLVMHHGPRQIARRTIEITSESETHELTE